MAGWGNQSAPRAANGWQHAGGWSQWQRDVHGNWQWAAAPPSSAWRSGHGAGSRLWQCKVCGSTNHSPKTCAVCGVRRSWADVVQAPASPVPASAGQATRHRLDELTSQLASLSVAAAPPPSSAAPPPTPSAPPVAPAATLQEIDPAVDKKAVQAKIKSLETALAAVPADEPDMADMLRARIQAQRQLIVQTKPLGARLDAARAALGRAQQRHDEATKALEAAQLLHASTAEDVGKLQVELRDLEQQVAHAPPDDPASAAGAATSAGHPDAATEQPPMQQVHLLLSKVLADMAGDAFAVPEHIAAAKEHVQMLYTGFKKTADAAQQARAAAAAVERGGAPTTRFSTKRPPPTATVASMVRHTGKQPPKGVIDSYFTKTRKVAMVDGKAVVFRQAPGRAAE